MRPCGGGRGSSKNWVGDGRCPPGSDLSALSSLNSPSHGLGGYELMMLAPCGLTLRKILFFPIFQSLSVPRHTSVMCKVIWRNLSRNYMGKIGVAGCQLEQGLWGCWGAPPGFPSPSPTSRLHISWAQAQPASQIKEWAQGSGLPGT
jgi:hypothetical protein